MTDQELITGILNRDKSSVQYLVSTFHRQIIKTAYNFVHNMEDAEDIAQDVCIEVLESVKHFRKDASFATWIYRITVNKSLNHIRKSKRRGIIGQLSGFFQNDNQEADKSFAEPFTNENQYHEQEQRKLLNNAINHLPENQRTAFILTRYEGLSNKQVAEVMRTSIAGVESLLQRAKHNLQKSLISHFAEYATRK